MTLTEKTLDFLQGAIVKRYFKYLTISRKLFEIPQLLIKAIKYAKAYEGEKMSKTFGKAAGYMIQGFLVSSS